MEHANVDARRMQDGETEIGHFFADIEELLKRITHVSDADVDRLKERVRAGAETTRAAVRDASVEARRRAGESLTAVDSYAHERPWQIVGLAAVAGAAIGFLASRR
jgi:ElaB/YqjD/DUF883 family membrane-anchored ribosome-binding protein